MSIFLPSPVVQEPVLLGKHCDPELSNWYLFQQGHDSALGLSQKTNLKKTKPNFVPHYPQDFVGFLHYKKLLARPTNCLFSTQITEARSW